MGYSEYLVCLEYVLYLEVVVESCSQFRLVSILASSREKFVTISVQESKEFLYLRRHSAFVCLEISIRLSFTDSSPTEVSIRKSQFWKEIDFRDNRG